MKRVFLVLAGVLFAGAALAEDVAYVERLRTQYEERITFQTTYARKRVMRFAVNCASGDGRDLPLYSVLLVKLASADGKKAWMVTHVDSQGEDVRIYDRLVNAEGDVLHSVVAFEINKWGEIRSPNGKLDALRNACFGSYGPIWRLPREQGRR